MKKIILLSLIAILSLSSYSLPADLTDVLNGQKVTLDGTSQRIKLKKTKTLQAILQHNNGVVTLYITPLGAAGAYIGIQTVDNSVQSLVPQNEHIVITVMPEQEDLYVMGTNTQTLRISY